MDPFDYEQCQEKGLSRIKILSNVSCPSECMVNCVDTKITAELSSSAMPGFYAFCGDRGDELSVLACLYGMV